MAKLKCRFCRRSITTTRYIRHLCNKKKEAKVYHDGWKLEHRDDKVTINKYPTFESWDQGILDGTVYYPSYPFCPPGILEDEHEQQTLDNDDSDGKDDFGNEGVIAEQGSEWKRENDDSKPINPNGGGLIKPSEQSWEPQEEDEYNTKAEPSLKATAEKVIASGVQGVQDLKETFRISAKEKAWLPVVAGVHEALMWAFEAKNKQTYFKLTRAQKKILTASYQATLGDSPFLKLKTKGAGEYDVHVIVAYIEIYGEFGMTNLDGAIDRGQGLWSKWQKRSKERALERPMTEVAENEVENVEKKGKAWGHQKD